MIEDQMKHGKTTLIEAMINQELGEPFRRDAMKKPVAVAGIDPADMRPQAAGGLPVAVFIAGQPVAARSSAPRSSPT
jgi:hypothetical protein